MKSLMPHPEHRERSMKLFIVKVEILLLWKRSGKALTRADICKVYIILVDFLVSLVATHFTDCIFEHDILLEEVVDGHFTLRIVVHRALEEEAQEALRAITSLASSEVGKEHEVEQQRSGKNRVAAKEVDLYLHGIAHPSEDINIIPSLLIIVAGRIVIDANLVVIVRVEIGLFVGLENAFQGRKFRNFLCVEVGWFVEHQTIAVAQDVGREPST